ncbi:unnamed protein product [Ectocarpus sp. CCAP 1310/34]|nr:unnamed protein product [Ectocarpus sp. CCAP 1310/34]
MVSSGISVVMNPRRPPRGRHRRGTSAYIRSTRQERTRENNRVREMQRRYEQRRSVDDMVIDDDYVHGGSSSDGVERIVFNREIPTAAIETTEGQKTCRDSANLMTPLRAEALLQGLQDFRDHMFAGSTRRVNNIPGTAKRSMRGTSVFYAKNSSSVATELPLAATGLLDMITVVLAGKKKPKTSDLGRLLGARKSMIRDIIDYMLDKEEKLVVGFPLAKSLPISEEKLDSYSENGAIPRCCWIHF